MTPGIPDWLRYEIQHRLEGWRDQASLATPRERLNAHPTLIASVAGSSMLLLGVVLLCVFWSASGTSHRQGKMAWFCDISTGKLFVASSKKAGPITAPSGPAPNGEPAGFRAHVYSYVLDPNESELFVGFLERPDPDARREYAAADMTDSGRWIRGHLIRRPTDTQWVRAAGPEGQAILKELILPNKRGQTPIQHVPDNKRSARK